MMEIRLKLTFLENLFLCLCLLTGLGQANGATVIKVSEGSEAVLPCFIKPEQNIERDAFVWKKNRQMVFLYKNGSHSNNGLPGQDEQFKGRVSHFPEQLQFSDASIRIRDTKESDSGTYICDFSPDESNRKRFTIKLVVVSAVIKVREGSEAVLPCFIRPKKNIERDVFDWKKDDEKEVFFHEEGFHSNSGRDGQDEQFRGRVSHFPEQLQFGDASIRINNTRVSDRGTYSCHFPRLQPEEQIFYIELVVVCSIIKDRWEEKIRGASLKPHITIFDQSRYEAKLQCDVQRVSPKPKVEWQDGSGNILPAKEPQVTERRGSYYIILNTTVTETGDYRCVVTQEEICHQISAVTFVFIHGPEPPEGPEPSKGWTVAVVVLVLGLLLAVILCICCKKDCSFTKDRWEENIGGETSELTVMTFKTDDRILLLCVVFGAFPKPKVEWQDSSGKILPAEEPQITERGGRYYMILETTVKETGKYRCVVKQEGINHQVSEEISVKIPVFTGAEPSKGEASKLTVMKFKTKDGMLLQCDVQGASPKPKLVWQDSSGNILPAKELQVTERGGIYDIILHTFVTKTGKYRCVIKQEEIGHQIDAEIFVFIPDSQTERKGNQEELIELNRNPDTSGV